MWQKSWWSWLGAGVLSTSLPLVGVVQADDPAAQPPPLVRALRLVADQAGGKDGIAFVEAPASEFWIGVSLGGELSDIVKEQLGLDHGLIVEDVLPDSPAAKAGFKKNDILLKSGDKALQDPMELIKAVEEAKETELSIGLVRGGKEMTIKVTPTKRPKNEYEARTVEVQPPAGELREEIKRLEDALKMLKDKAGGQGLGLMFARPGIVAPKQVIVRHGEFPDDLSIEVKKEGNHPAKIHVKKGDKEWDVTEDKMGELPDDVRPHVHQFFGGLWGPGLKEMAARLYVGGPKVAPVYPQPVPPVAAPVPALPGLPGTPAAPPTEATPRTGRTFQYRIETRGADDKLDEIMKELKQLRKDVDELRRPADEKK